MQWNIVGNAKKNTRFPLQHMITAMMVINRIYYFGTLLIITHILVGHLCNSLKSFLLMYLHGTVDMYIIFCWECKQKVDNFMHHKNNLKVIQTPLISLQQFLPPNLYFICTKEQSSSNELSSFIYAKFVNDTIHQNIYRDIYLYIIIQLQLKFCLFQPKISQF